VKFTARTWKFPDNINTDLILPNRAFYLTPEEQVKFVFSANRPGWVDQVQPGDILIGGKNFGMGSSRPAARSLRNLKLACLVAESINGLFFRNSVNFGFPALECPGVEAAFSEGDVAEVSMDECTVRNRRTGAVLKASPLPEALRKLMLGGGLYQLLESEGYLAAKPPAEAAGEPVTFKKKAATAD
jgi:3-isopropylmalate/(R)-2-methylmalate dehydratase small subunit